MALKPITRQEQIIAGKELEPVTRMEKFLKDYGVSNYFGEVETVVNEPLNITWDGNIEGLVSVAGMMYKVSDAIPTDEQIKSATIVFAGTEMPLTSDDWDGMVASGNVTEEIVNLNFLVMFVRKEGAVLQGVTIPETGIYFANNQGEYTSSLTTTEPVLQTKIVVKKLDMKYLPIDEIKAALGI